ncbi:MBL fold metallo-hydrolase [Terrabacter sp. NPDC080008]|uniref:MBL fold metallo-hydrolase n=1 Tax=Terrabacter sp. NPDC080008 TaxID=3155176 RepID=UPI00344EEDDD
MTTTPDSGERSGGTYTGHVTAGGPAAVKELSALTIRKLEVGGFGNNAYLLTCRATGEQLLVDAAADPERLQELVASGGDGLATVVTTHSHHDHVGALAEVVAATGARTVAGADDADALPVPVDVRVSQGDTVAVGDVTLDVIHLRGHTPGSIALAYPDPEGHTHLFTGDSLFPGGVGNTKNPGQSFDSLIEDVTTRVFDVYDDDTWFYPGHGDDSTLGAERPHLPEWHARGW